MTMEAGDSSPCCKCGTFLPVNKLKAIKIDICGGCFKSEVIDMKRSLPPKQVTIQHCLQCDCYFRPPELRMKAQFGSKELMFFCVKILNKINFALVNAVFVGTEVDYSETKIIKVKLSLRKYVYSGWFTIQQDHVVEYLVEDQTCNTCSIVSSNLGLLVSSTL
ncbi:hypothetical protein LguiB_017947 [Lonicera macranthoides]